MRERRTYITGRKLLLAIMAVFILYGSSSAQADSIMRPRIGNHYFTPVSSSKLPFTNTYFYTVMGYGQTINLAQEPGFLSGQPLTGLQGEMTFIDMGFSYQQRVRNWLAAYIRLSVAARLGTQIRSLLTQGINTISGFEIGWQIQFLNTDHMALSATFGLENYKGSFVNILEYVRQVIDNHPFPSLNRTVPVLNVVSGLRYAWGFNDLLGFKASFDIGYGETYTRGVNGFSLDAGAGLDLDLYPRYSVPLGFVIQYNVTGMPDAVYVEGKQAHIIRSKIAYTRAYDFSLGIEIIYMRAPLLNSEKLPAVYGAALAARYYF